MLCDDLERWDGGRWKGGSKGKGSIYIHTHTHISLIRFVVQQKLTQHCKAIIFQLKNKSKKQSPLSILKEWPHMENEIYHLTPT